MAKRRKIIGAKEKAKVALAAVKDQKTARELSTQFKVHVTQVGAWKKKLIEAAPEIFERDYKGSREQEFQQRESELFEEIGRLKMELEWVKKKAATFD
jgi:putative transposase